MNKPKDLDPISTDYWKRHAPRLKKEGLLNEATTDSFTILCRTFSLLHSLDPVEDSKTGVLKFVALTKIYQTLSRGFGMNTDKPKKAEPEGDKDEFGL